VSILVNSLRPTSCVGCWAIGGGDVIIEVVLGLLVFLVHNRCSSSAVVSIHEKRESSGL
jgi:hypothetical protein